MRGALMATFVAACLVSAPGAHRAASAQAGDSSPSLRMALVNMKCVYSDLPDEAARKAAIDANIRRHISFIDHAVARGAEFVGFPELSLNGYRFGPHVAWLSIAGPEVRAIASKAREKGVYVSVGLASQDDDGRKWNTQIVIGPQGDIVGKHHKLWLTAESGHVERGGDFAVFDVKGIRTGILICADGSDYGNLKALVDRGARLIYAPHANSTGSTVAGWYRFRSKWGGAWSGEMGMHPTNNDGPPSPGPREGWIDQLDVHAALHNHAGVFNPEFEPPIRDDAPERWASGAWFIGPEGQTLAQMPTSGDRADSKEYVLIHDIPIPTR